jgi:hypothetical protein
MLVDELVAGLVACYVRRLAIGAQVDNLPYRRRDHAIASLHYYY